MKNKKAAMEMSVGTIVTIVLLMSVLVLGLMLTKSIFTSAQGAIGKTDAKLIKEIDQIYGDESKVGIYPGSEGLTLKHGKKGEIGIVVRNTLPEVATSSVFSYEVKVMEIPSSCPLSEAQALSLIKLGRSGSMTIGVGESGVFRSSFEIKDGAPLCSLRYEAIVEADGEYYGSGNFDITIEA